MDYYTALFLALNLRSLNTLEAINSFLSRDLCELLFVPFSTDEAFSALKQMTEISFSSNTQGHVRDRIKYSDVLTLIGGSKKKTFEFLKDRVSKIIKR
ncbi:conserved hypothetical protein [Ricinus communis]|uniref:Uncharacterized protein n=1 Tax=Ricinus communis TaxID=3988 RepID=B9RY14_RICCO|nr:conserved hypothetical protein [Ricinus communis]